LHGRTQRYLILCALTSVLAVPASASADVGVTVGSAQTSRMTSSTTDGVTTFVPDGTGPASVGVADLQGELGAGRDVAVDTGDGTGPVGAITITAPLTAVRGELDLVASGAVTATAPITVEALGVLAGGAVSLDQPNHLQAVAVDTPSPEVTKITNNQSLELDTTSVGGPLTVTAVGGLDLSGAIAGHGPMVLVADAVPLPAPRGDVHAAPGTTIDAAGGPVALYSSRRDTARLAGLKINGADYVPGAAFVPSDSEVWGHTWLDGTPFAMASPYRFVFEQADRTMPKADIRLVRPETYAFGQVVPFKFTCSDLGGSGLASCTSDQHADGTVDTSAAGGHDVHVTAVDRAGNVAVVSAHYFVRAPRAPCVAPTTVTLKIERPKGTKSVVATLAGKRQKVKLSTTRIAIAVDVTGRAKGKYPLKVTIRRAKHLETVVRRPKVVVYACRPR
jgi:hypothetical protein